MCTISLHHSLTMIFCQGGELTGGVITRLYSLEVRNVTFMEIDRYHRAF
ncbi:MAG TPA: hypothetical protein VIZ65_07075 [Cellvibrionaceae bacterium]